MKLLYTLGLLLLPIIVSAQVQANNYKELADGFGRLLNRMVPVLLGIILLVFMWGLVLYILKSGSGDKASAELGRSLMIGGVIGLFVAVTVWGLVFVLLDSVFGQSGLESRPPIPEKRLPSNLSN